MQVAILADLFKLLNVLNKKMQGKYEKMLISTDQINAFYEKMFLLGTEI